MRDIDIRHVLRKRLLKEFRSDSLIVEEMVIPGRESRIDMAVINGQLHGFEIKSDSDTIKRLPSQRDAYNSLFDRITLIVGACHDEQALRVIPEWWGVCSATQRRDAVELKLSRKARLNPRVDPLTIVALLRRAEVANLLKSHGITRGLHERYIFELNRMLVDKLPLDDLKKAVRGALKQRQNWKPDALRT